MSDRIGNEVRNLVATRAEQRCEYCLIHEDDTFWGASLIISLKHAGPDDPGLGFNFPERILERHRTRKAFQVAWGG